MAKKLSLGILLAALVAGQMMIPVTASAVPTAPPDSCTIRRSEKVGEYLEDCQPAGDSCELEDPEVPCALCCLLGSVFYITDIVFVVLIVIVMILVLVGAFNILFAGGDPERVDAGRDYILYALIGFALAILAKGVPAIVSFLLSA